ncbi:MAG: hypothetical protein ISS94_05040 [Candidatus Syntrophoarchaeum sp.]|nr:hypothetical protein [Methanomicrobia archaeon]MBL7118131.1 hypothetical protein [Candidatus Syntrophoarchaeum sp.]
MKERKGVKMQLVINPIHQKVTHIEIGFGRHRRNNERICLSQIKDKISMNEV